MRLSTGRVHEGHLRIVALAFMAIIMMVEVMLFNSKTVCAADNGAATDEVSTAKSTNKPNIIVRDENGKAILVKEGSLLYHPGPLEFMTDYDVQDGELLVYSLNESGSASNIKYYFPEGNSVVVRPDMNTIDRKWVFSFGVINECGELKAFSDDIMFVFDEDGPLIKPERMPCNDVWISGKPEIVLSISDGVSGIERVMARAGDEIVYEWHEREKFDSIDAKFICDKDSIGGEGTCINVTATDMAGNVTDEKFYCFIDNNAPQVTVEAPTNGSVETEDTTVHIEATDNNLPAVTMCYEVRQAIGGNVVTDKVELPAQDCNGNHDIMLTEDGDYDITVYAYDCAGNTSEKIEKVFRIDKSAPKIIIDGVCDGTTYSDKVDAQIEVNDSFLDDVNVSVTVLKRLNDEVIGLPVDSFVPSDNCNRASIVLKEEGDYEIRVTAYDRAGHHTEASSAFRIDKSSGGIRIEGVKDNSVYKTIPSVKVQLEDSFYKEITYDVMLTANGTASTLPLKQDAIMAGMTEEIVVPVEGDGSYTLSVCMKDQGRIIASKQCSFRVDTTPPVIAISDDIKNAYLTQFSLNNGNTIKIDDMSECTKEVYINEQLLNDGEIIIAEGKYSLYVQATDDAGNLAYDTAQFMIDRTPPTPVISGISSSGYFKPGTTVRVYLDDKNDKLDSVCVNRKNIDIDRITNEAIFTTDSNENVSIEIKAIDKAGNSTDKTVVAKCENLSEKHTDVSKVERLISMPSGVTGDNEKGNIGLIIGIIAGVVLVTGTAVYTKRRFQLHK